VVKVVLLDSTLVNVDLLIVRAEAHALLLLLEESLRVGDGSYSGPLLDLSFEFVVVLGGSGQEGEQLPVLSLDDLALKVL